MTAAAALLWSLLASSGTLEPVRLVPFQCADVSDRDVHAPLRVELRGQLLDDRAATPPGAAIVAATCAETELLLSLAIPGRTSPPARRVALGGLRPDTRARAVALSIAELLRSAPPDDDDDDEGDAPETTPAPAPPPLEKRPNTSMYIAARWLKLPNDLDAFVFGLGLGWTMYEHWFARAAVSIGKLTDVDKMDRDDPGLVSEIQLGRSFPLYANGHAVLSWAPTVGASLAMFRQEDDIVDTRHLTNVLGAAAGVSLLADRDDPCAGFAPRHGSALSAQLLYVQWFGAVADRDLGLSGWGFMANMTFGLAF